MICQHLSLALGRSEFALLLQAINPGDVKKRSDTFGVGMPYPRVIPHSDGAGEIDQVGDGVTASRKGERVWCFGAQSYRPFGTAAEYVVVPAALAVPLPDNVSFELGACLGIPGITAHRAVHVAGPVTESTVLVQGAAGAVGQCAVALARHAGARVIATVRSGNDLSSAQRAGAQHIVVTENLAMDAILEQIREHAPDGVDHIVDVAFDSNIESDVKLLKTGGSIATYASGGSGPTLPFWPLVFKNVALFFLGSDDFPLDAKREAARALNQALQAGWPGFTVGACLPLESIAEAHEMVRAAQHVGARCSEHPGRCRIALKDDEVERESLTIVGNHIEVTFCESLITLLRLTAEHRSSIWKQTTARQSALVSTGEWVHRVTASNSSLEPVLRARTFACCRSVARRRTISCCSCNAGSRKHRDPLVGNISCQPILRPCRVRIFWIGWHWNSC